MSKVYRGFGAKVMEMKVEEINAPLNCAEVNVYKNLRGLN